MQHKTNFCIKDLTFLKTGGVVDIFYAPDNIIELQGFINNLNKDIDVIALGYMSNVIISDNGFRGCVICFRDTFNNISFNNNNTVSVGAGASVNTLIKTCIENDLSCIEDMYCIPGSIGGAIFMNAGTPLFEISESIISIECINKKTGEIVILDKRDINFEYRKSNIHDDLIITSCLLKTKESNKKKLTDTINEIAKKRKETQPIGARTCGSTFKNPTSQKAWQLIEKAGCRNMKIGDASVSDLHCNFIVNNGEAKSADIINLVRQIKDKVFENSNILLEEEIVIVGS